MTVVREGSAAADPMLVAAWAAHGPADVRGCCIVPTPALARLYRRQGERGVRLALGGWLLAQGITAEVRLVAELPPAGAMPGPRPRTPQRRELRLERDGFACTLEPPYDLAIFAGHFPWVPIVPGAMIVGWAAALAAGLGFWPHGLARIGAVKFRHIVQPGIEFQLRVTVDASRERLELRLESSRGLHAMGVLLAPATSAAA